MLAIKRKTAVTKLINIEPVAATESSVSPVDRVLRVRQVCEQTGLCRAMIYNLEAAGRFPERIRLSPNAVGWLQSEVTTWVHGRFRVCREAAQKKTATPTTQVRI